MTDGDLDPSVLEPARRVEKEQALRYRRLAALAESVGDPALAQRFHELHADEQHHLSRLTARILELGGQPMELADVRPEAASLEDWEQTVRAAEATEVRHYHALLAGALDAETGDLIREILAVESHHAEELGGKWTLA